MNKWHEIIINDIDFVGKNKQYYNRVNSRGNGFRGRGLTKEAKTFKEIIQFWTKRYLDQNDLIDLFQDNEDQFEFIQEFQQGH